MDFKELTSALGFENIPDFLEELYNSSEEEYLKLGLWYLEEKFLCECQEKYNFFGPYFEECSKAAKQIKEDKYLGRYLSLLRYIVTDRTEEAVRLFGRVPLPKATGEDDLLKTEMMPFFVYPPEAEHIDTFLREKGFPEESVKSAIEGFFHSIGGFKGRFGRVGFERLYLVWCMHFAECKLVKFGALEFELKKFDGAVSYFVNNSGGYVILGDGMTYHKSGNRLGNLNFTDEEGSFEADLIETDEYFEGVKIKNCLAVNRRVKLSKSEWKRVLKKGDNIINVHIPGGTDLSKETLDETFRDAEKLFAGAFPDYNAKAFVCFSWLMDPELERMLKPSAKIVGFQNRFMRFPMISAGKDVFIFLFKEKFEKYEDLPENTSLERAVKQYYIDGNCIHKFGGAFFTELQEKNR